MADVIYAPEADDDLEAIVDYIARDKPRAARDWLLKIRETCEALAAQTALGEERKGFGIAGCRSFSAGNTSCSSGQLTVASKSHA